MKLENNSAVKAITNLVFMEELPPLKPCDIAIVLGNDFDHTMDDVAELYQNGMICKKILITGHSASKDREPEALRFFRRGLERGIPEQMMLLEAEATNSYENLLFSKKALEQAGLLSEQTKGILFVGKAFVARRIFMTARKLDYPASKGWCYYPTVDTNGLNITRQTWSQSPPAAKRVLEEMDRIARYTLQGDLAL